MLREIRSGLSATDSLQNLRPRGRRLRHNMQAGITPVRRHLPSAGTWIVSRSHRLQKHLIRLGAQGQAQRAVAVIRIEPVIAGLKHQPRRHPNGFVSRSRHLEVDFLLALQQDFPIVDTPGGEHVAVGLDQLVTGKPVVGLGFLGAIGRKGQLGVSFCRRHPFPWSYPADRTVPIVLGLDSRRRTVVSAYQNLSTT